MNHESSSSTSETDMNDNDDVDLEESLDIAEELKLEGNDHFRASRWDEALTAYRAGCARLPKRKEKGKESSIESKGGTVQERLAEFDQRPEGAAETERSTSEETVDQTETLDPLVERSKKARAIMNANIAACFVRLGEHSEAVKACTEALQDDPNYVKALQRRALANETINTWSSLTNAQEDYSKLLNLLPSSSPQLVEVRRSLRDLKPRVEAAQKRETDEMLQKLKGLGNSILGKFGWSTDDFKLEPNGQGGYSLNISR